MSKKEKGLDIKNSEFNFCPLCQAPLLFLKISPLTHVASCSVIWDSLPDCPDGVQCLNISIFHYRDYAHSVLAAYRSSEFYVSPPVELFSCNSTSPKKHPSNSPKKSNKKKILKTNVKHQTSDIPHLNKKDSDISKNKKSNFNSKDINKLQQKLKADDSCWSEASDDEISLFKNRKTNLKRTTGSRCDNKTKTLAKKMKTVENNLKNYQKMTGVDDSSRVLKNTNSTINKESGSSVNDSEICDNGCFNFQNNECQVENLEDSNDVKIFDEVDKHNFPSNFINETHDVKVNLSNSSSTDSEEIDFGRNICTMTSSLNDARSFSVSSSSISYSPLGSQQLNPLMFNIPIQLNSEISEIVLAKTDKEQSSFSKQRSVSLSSSLSISYSPLGSDHSNEINFDVDKIISPKIEEKLCDSLKQCNNASASSSSISYSPLESDKSNELCPEINGIILSETLDKLNAPNCGNSVSSSSSSSFCYSPLESDKSDQLCFDMNEIVTLNSESNRGLDKNEVVLKKSESSPKTFGIFVPKTERNCKLKIGENSASEFLGIKNISSKSNIVLSNNEKDCKLLNKDSVSPVNKYSENSCIENKNLPSKVKTTFEKNTKPFCDKEHSFSVAETVSGNRIFMGECDDLLPNSNNFNIDPNKFGCSRGSSSQKPIPVAEKIVTFGEVHENVKVDPITVKKNPSDWQRNTAKKICPFFKRIPNTSIVVDAFNYGCIPGISSYFLSHFHYDHYIGLKKSFAMPIFCSEITAKLVKLTFGIDDKWLNIINVGERRVVSGTEVVALDANHCPGSLMFLFQLRNGENYLHVGDFRYSPCMETYPELKQLHINKLFLDTTYCKPEYDFPTQEEIVAQVVNIVRDKLLKENSSLLIVCGSYTIGKEKVFCAVAEACNCSIWADSKKKRVLKCLSDPIITSRLSDNALEAQVHVVPMHIITYEKLENYLSKYNSYSKVVAFRPTGWTAKNSINSGYIRKGSHDRISIYDIPYSEHSSFSELRRFVQFLKPGEIVPTVNIGNPATRNEMSSYFKSWISESKQLKNMNILNFIQYRKTKAEEPL